MNDLMKETAALNLTETKVYLLAWMLCESDYCADVDTIAKGCGLSVAQAKGYVGVLTKKGYLVSIDNAKEGEMEIFAVTKNGKTLSFGEEEF